MCETLPPFGECGFGNCVNGTCECFDGYSQNVEFFYGTLPQGGPTFCDYSRDAMIVTAVIMLALTLSSVALNLYVLDNMKQVKRLTPLLLSYTLLIISLVMRLVWLDESLFGFNVAYSFILTACLALLLVQEIIYLNKFLMYAVNVFRFKAHTRQLAQAVVKLQYLLAAIIFCGTMIFSSTSLVDSQEVKYQLVLTTISLSSFAHTGFIVTSFILFTKYISDLQLITKNSSKWDSAFVRKCRRNIPRMRFVRESTAFFNAWSLAFNLLAVGFSGWLKIWVYVLYLNFFGFQLTSILILRAAGKLRCGKKHNARTETRTPNTSVISLDFSGATEDVTSKL